MGGGLCWASFVSPTGWFGRSVIVYDFVRLVTAADAATETVMEKLIEDHLAEVADLCRRVGARRLDLFGSAARGEFDPSESDLDFFVEFDDLPPARYADAFFSLKQNLEALFGRPVDLITEACLANPYFRARIEAERQAVYAR